MLHSLPSPQPHSFTSPCPVGPRGLTTTSWPWTTRPTSTWTWTPGKQGRDSLTGRELGRFSAVCVDGPVGGGGEGRAPRWREGPAREGLCRCALPTRPLQPAVHPAFPPPVAPVATGITVPERGTERQELDCGESGAGAWTPGPERGQDRGTLTPGLENGMGGGCGPLVLEEERAAASGSWCPWAWTREQAGLG